MLIDPFENELLLPTVYRVGALLAGTLVALLIIARHRLGTLGEDVLFQRWRTWAVIAPVYLAAVLGGAVPTVILVTWLVFQGLREYARLVGLPPLYRRILLAMGVCAPPLALVSTTSFYLLPPLLLILGTLQPLIMFRRDPTAVTHLAFAALGWGYIAWFLSSVVLIERHVEGGRGILLALGLGVALSDIGAFVFGRLFGRHKMAPLISPNKTWEGVAGNLVGAYLGVAIMSFALPVASRSWLLASLPLIFAAGSLWGDLVESVVKREFGAKDAGAWLPGFGGLLDRIDSLLLAAPLSYYFLVVFA